MVSRLPRTCSTCAAVSSGSTNVRSRPSTVPTTLTARPAGTLAIAARTPNQSPTFAPSTDTNRVPAGTPASPAGESASG